MEGAGTQPVTPLPPPQKAALRRARRPALLPRPEHHPRRPVLLLSPPRTRAPGVLGAPLASGAERQLRPGCRPRRAGEVQLLGLCCMVQAVPFNGRGSRAAAVRVGKEGGTGLGQGPGPGVACSEPLMFPLLQARPLQHFRFLLSAVRAPSDSTRQHTPRPWPTHGTTQCSDPSKRSGTQQLCWEQLGGADARLGDRERGHTSSGLLDMVGTKPSPEGSRPEVSGKPGAELALWVALPRRPPGGEGRAEAGQGAAPGQASSP